MPIVFDDEDTQTTSRIVFDDEPAVVATPTRKGPAPKQRSYEQRDRREASAQAKAQWDKLPWYVRATTTPDELVPGGMEARNQATADAAPILAGMAGQALNPETYYNAFAGGINSTADLLTGRAPGETQTIPQAHFLPGGDALRELTAPVDETMGEAIQTLPPVVQKMVGAAALPASIMGAKGVQSALKRGPKPEAPTPRTSDDLRTSALSELDQAMGQQAELSGKGFDKLSNYIGNATKGIDVDAHPTAVRARNVIGRLQSGDIGSIEQLRRTIRDLASEAKNDTDRRMVTNMSQSVREFLNNIDEADVTGGDVKEIGDSLAKYRKLYQHAEISDTMDGLLEQAKDRSTATPGLSLHKALQTEIRKLVLNDKEMRMLPKEVQSQLQSLSTASLPEKASGLLHLPANHPWMTLAKYGVGGLAGAQGASTLGDFIASKTLSKRLGTLSRGVREAAPDTNFVLRRPPGTTGVRPVQGELFPDAPDTSPGAGTRQLDAMESEALRQQLGPLEPNPTQEFDFGGMEAPNPGVPMRLPGKRPSEQSRLLEQPEPNTDKGAYAEGAMAPSDVAAKLLKARKDRPVFRYTSAEKSPDGLASIKSDYGYTLADDLGDGRLMVKNTWTKPEARGKGDATARYKELIANATMEGKRVVSGTTITADAQKVIARLKKEGHVAKINPYRVNKENGSWYSADPRVPIVEFNP